MSERQTLLMIESGEVVFPGVVVALEVSPGALADELRGGHVERVVVVETVHHDVGIEAMVKDVVDRGEDSGVAVVVIGGTRRKVRALLTKSPFFTAEVDDLDEPAGKVTPELVQAVRSAAKTYVKLSGGPKEALRVIDAIESPGLLADCVAANASLPPVEQRAIISELDIGERLTRVLASVTNRLRSLEGMHKGDPRLHEEVLRQRMREIQAELGEESESPEVDELGAKLKDANLPPEIDKAAQKELRRLRGINEQSPEHQISRTWLEWIAELPWSKRSDDAVDLPAARKILDEDHHGLEKIKKRVLEYLAVRKLKPNKKGPILLFVGPPGVGKTSLAKSIARALGRELVRASLGGVRDEAEIRGHRRTYIGALPGRIIQALRRAGTKNPVFLLDELDKLGADFRGDPSAALLEVLDPEQNFSFADHYLELPFDLSEVIFIATANDLDTIPPALRDRLEIVTLSGYTEGEKTNIARTHLVPKQLAEHGLTDAQVTITDAALVETIDGYTREAGVRSLERKIAEQVRAIAVQVAVDPATTAKIDARDVSRILGPRRFESEAAERGDAPGVATGLAWTPTGGELLFIEATAMPGKGKLILTGQLGDVMKESAQAAHSLVRSHAAEWGIPAKAFEQDLHLHFPAGGIQKDGPSAGQAIVTALVSLLTGRRVAGDVAMTGEITLRGRVLPVGGISTKLLAAHRAGIKRISLPERNAKDLADLPQEVRDALEIHLVKKVDETLGFALEPERPRILAAAA